MVVKVVEANVQELLRALVAKYCFSCWENVPSLRVLNGTEHAYINSCDATNCPVWRYRKWGIRLSEEIENG